MIDPERVDEMFRDCLFRPEEVKEGVPNIPPVEVQGVVNKFGLHPDRIELYRGEVRGMLEQFGDEFMKGSGGGWTFLNMCNLKNDEQWTGLHQRMEQLVVMGIALGYVRYTMPKMVWSSLPGGMPYLSIDLEAQT